MTPLFFFCFFFIVSGLPVRYLGYVRCYWMSELSAHRWGTGGLEAETTEVLHWCSWWYKSGTIREMVTTQEFLARWSLWTPFGSVFKLFMAFDRFTQIIECMFQLQKFLQKLDELVGKMSYENDPIPERKPHLNKRVDTLLTNLIKRYTQTHMQHIH